MTLREYYAVHFALNPPSKPVNTYTTDEPFLSDDEKKRVQRMKERMTQRKT